MKNKVDFSAEVSTAVRLCDGAILLIDVCEGICPQVWSIVNKPISKIVI